MSAGAPLFALFAKCGKPLTDLDSNELPVGRAEGLNPLPRTSNFSPQTSSIHRHVPLRSASPPARFTVEKFMVTGHNRHARPHPRSSEARRDSDLCRARFQPRRRPMRLTLSTACADSPAQSPPFDAEVRAIRRGSLATRHSPLAAAILIYGTGIRNHSKSLKT
jgi:hypothetical protein